MVERFDVIHHTQSISPLVVGDMTWIDEKEGATSARSQILYKYVAVALGGVQNKAGCVIGPVFEELHYPMPDRIHITDL